MRDIARSEGMEAPSLYNHIKSKQEILSVLLMEIANEFISGMELVEVMEANYQKKVEALIALHVKISFNKRDAISLLTHDWRQLEEPTFSEFVEIRQDYEDRFRSIIQTGIKRGEFKDIHPDVSLFALLSTLRWLHVRYGRKGIMSEDEMTEQLIKALMGGVLQN